MSFVSHAVVVCCWGCRRAVYFDDEWTASGPTEMDGSAVADMGLSTEEVAALVESFNWVMDQAYEAILARGKFSWNQLWNGNRTPWINCPDPMVSSAPPAKCAADIRKHCTRGSMAQRYAMLYGFASGCNNGNPSSTSNLTDPLLDIAAFQLVRGPHAWLGHGWSGCDQVYERPLALDIDYGEPLGLCRETVPGKSGVFTREYSKSVVHLDCNSWSGNITIKRSDARDMINGTGVNLLSTALRGDLLSASNTGNSSTTYL
eukprot:SAG31_NODE_2226_length_6149_cov_9.156198_2_plen_260_part_00